MSHRKVDPNYRGNGIDTSAMRAIDGFVKEYSRKTPGREAVIEAHAGQLDVLEWFDRNGFETTMDPVAVHPGEEPIKVHNIDDVLMSLENEDGDYRVGPYMYVFPKEYEGSYFDGNGEEPENIRIDDSALVHFRKRLDVSGTEEVGEITGEIQKASTAVHRGDEVYSRQASLSPDLLLDLESQKGKILSDIAALLESGGIEDEVDQGIVKKAMAFIENPSENLEDILPHTKHIGMVLAEYDMERTEPPPEIDAIEAYLYALQCINRVKFVEKELALESPNFLEIKEACRRGKGWATTLLEKYSGDKFYFAVISAFLAAIDKFQKEQDKQ